MNAEKSKLNNKLIILIDVNRGEHKFITSKLNRLDADMKLDFVIDDGKISDFLEKADWDENVPQGDIFIPIQSLYSVIFPRKGLVRNFRQKSYNIKFAMVLHSSSRFLFSKNYGPRQV